MEIANWLVGALGLGSLITVIAQALLNQKSEHSKRRFQEKKEAYVGLLDAMYKSEIKPSEQASLYVGYWINICSLVGSQEVRELLIQHMETNPINGKVHPDRPKVMEELKKAMRRDLDVEK